MPWSSSRKGVFVVLAAILIAPVPALAGEGDEEKGPLSHLEWRNIGPVNMSGRVADVEGIPGDPRTVYVGSASGGIWKTTNGGLTFEPVFDDQPTASIGDLALAPSNPAVIYAGTGESNVRNSVSFGNGVYRSTDGGGHWQHLGLEETRYISRIVVHPTDPDTAWVGALGNVYGPHTARGVFRTTDGGKTWQKVLYLDDRHGVADLAIDPTNPKILFAGLWRFERRPWTHRSGSEEGGVWRSLDGGDTWKKVEKGLPKLMGRIGVKVAASNPDVVYVIAESDEGVLFRSDDGGESFAKVSDNVRIVSRGFYYTDLRIDPTDENRVYAISSRLFRSIDGGKSFERISRSTHVDYHSLWIDPTNPDRIWQGQDGGVAVSYDRGETWEPIRNLPLAQFYQIFFDDRRPFYNVGGGLQDNGTWVGPSRTREPAGILSDDWRMVSFGDAYFVVTHPDDPDLMLSEYQAGGIVRTDLRTRQQIDASPQPRRNDGGPVEKLEYRFNWNSPIIASPHDPRTVYFAGNVVFKSRDFGSTWERISPDLTTDDPDKQGVAGGPAWVENTTAEYHCTIISFAESPAEAGVLWAGTDDGNLQLSRDGGATWTDLTDRLRGVPAHSPVSHVEPSATDPGTAWVAFDRHMFADFAPHLYVTRDYGKTWRAIDEGLPEEGWIWVVRQDPRNPELLYVGTELGLYASWNEGGDWQRLHLGNLPTVAVHDLQIHPRENDLVVGTHGRAIWIFDDATPIQRFRDAEEDAARLFPIRPAMRFPTRFTRYAMGDKKLAAPNPAYGALITYSLPPGAEKEEAGGKGEGAEAREPRVKIEILAGEEVVRTLDKPAEKPGLNRVSWDLTYDAAEPRKAAAGEVNDFRGPPRGPEVLPGSYTVRLTVDGETFEQPVEVSLDPLVETGEKALGEQLAMGMRLRDLLSAAHLGLRRLDIHAAEVAARKETRKLSGEPFSPGLVAKLKEHEMAMEKALRPLNRLEGKPFWSQGPGVVEEIDQLYGNVRDAYDAPTAAQRELANVLEKELREAVSTLNLFFAQDVSALSEALVAEGATSLAAPAAVVLPEPVS